MIQEVGPPHHPGYQERDKAVVDYREYPFDNSRLLLRGPAPSHTAPPAPVACIGAAQTFGCFTEAPFPALLEQELGVPVRNLGYGGAGPRFFLEQPALLEEANRSSVAVVQVMSARSEDNRLYRSRGLEYLERRSDGLRIGSNAAYAAIVGGYDPSGRAPKSRWERRIRRRLARRSAIATVTETQEAWVGNYRQLFDRLTCPTVLLWFSTRNPDRREVYRSVHTLFGEYPQMVNQRMLDAIVPFADRYVEVVSSEGLPQPLFNRHDGSAVSIRPSDDRSDLSAKEWTHNHYYPSPEMHRIAADVLAPVIAQYLGRASTE